MTKAEFETFFIGCLDEMKRIRAAKNSDYTGTTDDPFANFNMSRALGICETETALLVRMVDKIARLKSFIEKGSHAVKDESVKDSCIDLANYALIFAGLWAGKQIGGTASKGCARACRPAGTVSNQSAGVNLPGVQTSGFMRAIPHEAGTVWVSSESPSNSHYVPPQK